MVAYRQKPNTSRSKMSTENEVQQQLKASVHYTVGLMCQQFGEDNRREFSRQAIAAIAETTFRQCDIFARDLEAFARHAKRTTVSAEDVKLAARRSKALSNFIHRKCQELNQEQMDLKKNVLKGKETEEESKD